MNDEEVLMKGRRTKDGRLKIKKIENYETLASKHGKYAFLSSIESGILACASILLLKGKLEVMQIIGSLLCMMGVAFTMSNSANNISKRNIYKDKIKDLEEEILNEKER